MIITIKTTAKQIPMVISIAKYQLYSLVNTMYKMDIATYMMKPTITSNQVLSPLGLSAHTHLSRNFNDFILVKRHTWILERTHLRKTANTICPLFCPRI